MVECLSVSMICRQRGDHYSKDADSTILKKTETETKILGGLRGEKCERRVGIKKDSIKLIEILENKKKEKRKEGFMRNECIQS